jgi:hypothetical protein
MDHRKIVRSQLASDPLAINESAERTPDLGGFDGVSRESS